MGIISGPKAINIVRPNNNTKSNYASSGLSVKSGKVISSNNHTTHEPKTAKPVLNLYNPKQQKQLLQTPEVVDTNKKPVIHLFNPRAENNNNNKFQLRRSFSTSVISPSRRKDLQTKHLQQQQQIVLSEEILKLHNNEQKSKETRVQEIIEEKEEEDLASLSDSDCSGSGSENSHSETEDEHSDEDEVDDSLPEARINRKLADLEISNQSLLIINEMLESTVRNQAKQVASFKKQMMTLPNDTSEQQRQEAQLLILQQVQQAENEEDWENDEQFNRLRRMTEMLIEEAQKALTYQVETGGRVISGHHHRRPSSRRVHRHRSERHPSPPSTTSTSSSLSNSHQNS